VNLKSGGGGEGESVTEGSSKILELQNSTRDDNAVSQEISPLEISSLVFDEVSISVVGQIW
jgi:hypothetical protein